MSLLLGGYFTYTRLQDAEHSLLERGQLLARLIASSSEFGFITNNSELLKDLSKGPLLEQDVSDILFLDGKYELILRSAEFPINLQIASGQTYKQSEYWYFTQPIVTTGIPFLDNAEFQESEQIVETIGWVVVVISESRKVQQEEQIFIANTLLLLLGSVFTFFLAQRFGKRISLPILELTQIMEKIQAGQYDARITNTYTGEFNSLAIGLNNLADTVHKSIKNQESKIELATRKLQFTLHHLEQQNSALATARKRADEANKAKDDFLARMSHELRTPLTSVVGFSKLLKQSPCTQEQLEHIRIINQTSQMLLSIIDDILDFSKLQQNAITIEHIPFNLENLIYDVMEMQAPQAHDKGLELIAHLPETERLEVIGDPTRLRQIISNILSNAVKFTERGSVETYLHIKHLNKQQSLFTLKVIDTGIGIPQKQLEQLFKAFMQADTSITRRFGGSGLGLVIAKKLTELMGGKLSMSSEESQGTTLTLDLPLKTNAHANTITNSSTKVHTSTMYYEENPSLRTAISSILKRQTSEVITLKSIEEIKLIAENNSVIISIPANPEKQIVLLKAIREISPHCAKLILLSPNCTNLPVTNNITILNKPVRPSRIHQAIQLTTCLEATNSKPHLTMKTIKVVVAEDNEFNSILIKNILNSFNIQSFTATTGLEAIKLVEEEKPDIVLMDAHMPIMDGFEATKYIKEKWPSLPIIALTANIIESEHIALYKAGVSKVLLKPINDSQLFETINALTTNVLQVDQHITQATDITKYDIHPQQLEQELQSLSKRLQTAFQKQQINAISEINHQIAGIAGLYELPEIECCVTSLQELIVQSSADWSSIWKVIWRLKRILDSKD
ncbi:ATP-binding protein [Neptunomonas japonica]|uniref:ATP-binding protein n=1 Tax=Neptunomonas japonica TaxID=417574 RepID=UPI0004134888|nr:ATP-binding protein [Neptunomonas japonica]